MKDEEHLDSDMVLVMGFKMMRTLVTVSFYDIFLLSSYG
jgi:hypothetical protein